MSGRGGDEVDDVFHPYACGGTNSQAGWSCTLVGGSCCSVSGVVRSFFPLPSPKNTQPPAKSGGFQRPLRHSRCSGTYNHVVHCDRWVWHHLVTTSAPWSRNANYYAANVQRH